MHLFDLAAFQNTDHTGEVCVLLIQPQHWNKKTPVDTPSTIDLIG